MENVDDLPWDAFDNAPQTDCLYCGDRLVGAEENIANRCRNCGILCCRSCLREWFLRASTSAASKGVMCCASEGDILLLGNVGDLLTEEEKKAYLSKREERLATYKLVFCPVPACSAFIPSRHYVVESARERETSTVVDGLYAVLEPVVPGPGELLPEASCPACGHKMCPKCRGEPHLAEEAAGAGADDAAPVCDREDAEDTLDAETAQALEEDGWKRCPRCTVFVQKDEGCSQVECASCHHWFCFRCLRAECTCTPPEWVSSEEDSDGEMQEATGGSGDGADQEGAAEEGEEEDVEEEEADEHDDLYEWGGW